MVYQGSSYIAWSRQRELFQRREILFTNRRIWKMSCLHVSKQMETPELRERAPGRGLMMTMRQRRGWTATATQTGTQVNSCRIYSHNTPHKNAHCCPPSRLVAVDDLSLPSVPCSVSPSRLPPALALGAPPSHAPSPMALLKGMSGVIYSVVRPVEIHPRPS